MKSVMTHSFSQVPRANIPRSSFNRSHGVKTTFDADELIPIFCDDVVPGDTFNLNFSFLARLTSPTVLPLMDNLRIETFWFFVPYRIIWENFPKFHGSQDDPGDSIDFTIPAVSSATSYDLQGQGSFQRLCNYFGLPYTATMDLSEITALPFRAYNLIWDDWFRDENLQNATLRDGSFGSAWGDDGPDAGGTDYGILKRGKRKDYFTGGLPWPQKGTALNVISNPTISASGDFTMTDGTTTQAIAGAVAGTPVIGATGNWTGGALQYSSGLQASAAATTINDLRLAFQTQRLLERDARSGTRYVEHVLAHYGVTVPDFRLQRPELLGSGSTRLGITPVAQTTYQGTQTVEDAKGSLAGIGMASGTHGFTKSFVEHGVIIGLVNARADITYSQGVERYFTKTTRYDFYYPVLATIGEQATLVKEIYYDAADPDAVFNYQERYAEYRYKPSRLTGLMGVDVANNLDEFHLSEDFASEPSFDSTFIQSNTSGPLDRAISVPTQPHFVLDGYFDLKCARPMPVFGVPGNLDHF